MSIRAQNQKTILIELHAFPSIRYLAAISAFDKVQIEAFENYQKGSYRNRYYIGSSQGALRLSIPLEKGKHQSQPITQVQMLDGDSWRKLHWRSIQSSYGKSPFYDFYKDELFGRFEDGERSLFNWNLENLKFLLKCFKLSLSMELSSTYQKDITDSHITDYRNIIKPQNTPSRTNLPKSVFHYEQVFTKEVGMLYDLSALDLLFCLGPEAGNRFKMDDRE